MSSICNGCKQTGEPAILNVGVSKYVNGDLLWFVAHTRPRCEKKLVQYCYREGLHAMLPCIKSAKHYVRKTEVFEKPLFPGYVFLQAEPERVRTIYQSEYTAKILSVYDQETFEGQLNDILLALESGCVVGMMSLSEGRQIRITSGPLAGMTGVLLNRASGSTVILQLDFIGRGAVVVVSIENIEVCD